MIKVIVVGIELTICFLLQSAVFPHFSLAGVVPDLLMILVVTNAYIGGQISGLLTGMFAGLLVDFYFGSYVGLYAGIYMIIGYLCGYSKKIYDRDDYIIPIVLFAVSELFYSFFYYVIEFLMRGRIHLYFYFYRIMLPKVLYTVLLGIVFYKLFQLIYLGVSNLRRKE